MSKILRVVSRSGENHWAFLSCEMEDGFRCDMSEAEYNYRMFKQDHVGKVLTEAMCAELDHLVHQLELQHSFEKQLD